MAKGRDERDEREDEAPARGAAPKVAEPAKPAAPARALPEVMGGGTYDWPVEVEKLEKGVRLSVGRHSIDLEGERLAALREALSERRK